MASLRSFLAARLASTFGQALFTLGIASVAAALLLYRTPAPPVSSSQLATITGTAHVQYQRTRVFLTVMDDAGRRMLFTCDRQGCLLDDPSVAQLSGTTVTAGYLPGRPDRLYTLSVPGKLLKTLEGSNRRYAGTAVVPFAAAVAGGLLLLLFVLRRPTRT